jgi:nucleoid DNA-binding protein
MNKDEFLKLFAKRAGISVDDARLFYEKFLQRFVKILKSGQSVKITGFGEFKVKKRKEKIIRDLNTQFERVIPAKILVNFSPAKVLIDRVNIKYKNLKPIVVKPQIPAVVEQEPEEFNLTFFEEMNQEKSNIVEIQEPKSIDGVKHEITEEVVKEVEFVIEESKSNEDYLNLPDKLEIKQIYEGIDVEVPVFDVFPKVEVEKEEGIVEEFFDEVKIKMEDFEMPEFNLTEEPQKPEEKKESKKFFDDTQKKEETAMAFEYEEEGQRRTGFWIFILIVFLIFIGGIVLLLNQYGYIRLWGEGKKPSKVEFKPPEEVVITTPPVSTPKEETPPKIEEKKLTPTVTTAPSKVEKPSLKAGKSYVVQVASFQDKKLADAYANNLRKKGYNAFVERAFVEWKGGNWYRVRVGYFDSIERANEVAQKLKRSEKLEKVWVSEAVKTVKK